MPAYHRFAAFYDEVMDDPGPRADRVLGFVDRHRPGATSVLELACGTGSILARLERLGSRTGLDRSPEMLARARRKAPGVRLIEGDMASFALGERFEVIVCVFDSLNHLIPFDRWTAMFGAVHRHLVDGGLFVFDVNTVGELRRLGEEPPWVYDFDDNVLIMDVTPGTGGLAHWDIRVFEHVGEYQYRLHEERIDELGVPLDRIRSALEPGFDLLEEADEAGGPPTDESVKAHFAYRRRP